MSADGQSVPRRVESKCTTFRAIAAPFDRRQRTVGMGHVQRPESESPRRSPKFTREELVPEAHCPGVGHPSQDGVAVHAEAGGKVYHFDPRL